jgi:hypothetical protein
MRLEKEMASLREIANKNKALVYGKIGGSRMPGGTNGTATTMDSDHGSLDLDDFGTNTATPATITSTPHCTLLLCKP